MEFNFIIDPECVIEINDSVKTYFPTDNYLYFVENINNTRNINYYRNKLIEYYSNDV